MIRADDKTEKDVVREKGNAMVGRKSDKDGGRRWLETCFRYTYILCFGCYAYIPEMMGPPATKDACVYDGDGFYYYDYCFGFVRRAFRSELFTYDCPK